mmetsp:Transcript_35348/g.60841  ORF Transcript_35348/g.60841 Transcript_35348/m.60841 type:complete len:218 (-) Transcript_35348:1327-1980(-)
MAVSKSWQDLMRDVSGVEHSQTATLRVNIHRLLLSLLVFSSSLAGLVVIGEQPKRAAILFLPTGIQIDQQRQAPPVTSAVINVFREPGAFTRIHCEHCVTALVHSLQRRTRLFHRLHQRVTGTNEFFHCSEAPNGCLLLHFQLARLNLTDGSYSTGNAFGGGRAVPSTHPQHLVAAHAGHRELRPHIGLLAYPDLTGFKAVAKQPRLHTHPLYQLLG